MTGAELETAVREGARPVVLVFDNARYGTIHDHQARRGLDPVATDLGPVDWAMVAEGYGAIGVRVETDEDFEPALRAALASRRPTVLHLVVDRRWVSVDRLDEAAPEPETESGAAGDVSEPESAPTLEAVAARETEAAPEAVVPSESVAEPEVEPGPLEVDAEPGAEGALDSEPQTDPEPDLEPVKPLESTDGVTLDEGAMEAPAET
jgi:hypothetical protein